MPLQTRRADRWSTPHSLPSWRRVILLLLSLACLPLYTRTSEATPSSAVSPASYFIGTSPGEQFGSAVDCNTATEFTTPHSLIAVGAPHAVGSLNQADAGKVYIIDPSSVPAAAVRQIIDPPSPQTGAEFGKAVAFFPDFNNDGISDLAVAQSSNSSGAVFFFQSVRSADGESATFSLCGFTSSSGYFGEVLAPLRAASGGGPTLLIGSPRSSPPSTRGISLSSSGSSCVVTDHASFSVSAAEGSRFGSALGFIGNQPTSLDGEPEMIVGAPRLGGAQNLAGSVYITYSDSSNPPDQPTPAATSTATALALALESAVPVLSGAATDLLGSSIASSEASSLFAASAPGALNGVGRVSLYESSGSAVCSFSPPLSESSVAFGRAIVGLGSTFSSLTGGSDLTIASYHSEPETGGSVALVGMNTATSACSQSLVKLNNCERQSSQRQGASLGGGSRCAFITHGALRSFLLVGAPGFSDNTGRIDLYADGLGIHGSSQECVGATPPQQSPAPNPTTSPTPSPTNNPGNPNPTKTPSPTPDTRRESGIDVYPNYDDLPEPRVEIVSPSRVAISLPSVIPRFDNQSYAQALKKLKRAGFSPAQAKRALDQVSFNYIITIEPLSSVSARGVMKKAFGAATKTSSKIRIRSRKNRASARLLPAASYTISYELEFYVTKPKRVTLGKTKRSAPTRFRLD